MWHSNVRPEALRRQVQVAPHGSDQFHIIVPLMNMQEFYQPFGGQDGNKMMHAQADRTKIW